MNVFSDRSLVILSIVALVIVWSVLKVIEMDTRK
tara:strand:- start:174 stop:275 length:102 start_codon:yes stop_codon:yes gene_type:complete